VLSYTREHINKHSHTPCDRCLCKPLADKVFRVR
jgi:hypothetical protein